MKKINTIQTAAWILFLLYYTASKYFAAFSGWNLAYALQVGIIVVLTAILPYYLTRFSFRFVSNRIPAGVLLPSALAMLGYAGFFFVFIQPNFAEVTALQVIPRGLISGVVISLILLAPECIRVFRRGGESQSTAT